MTWLARIFTNGFLWVRKNPIIIFIVVIVLAYNYFYPHITPQLGDIDITSLSSILEVLDAAYTFILTPQGQIAGWVAIITASGITMFNTGAIFGVFAEKPKPILEGLRTMFSDRWLEYVAFQFIVGLTSAWLFYLELWTFVYVLPSLGWLSLAIVLLSVLIVYPLTYILLSAGSMLIGAKAPLFEKLLYAKFLFKKNNLRRLVLFYGIRIGAELLVIYGAIFIAKFLSIPSFITTVVVILLITLPLAWVRTTGFVLKLEMLQEARWFRQFFATYYGRSQEDI